MRKKWFAALILITLSAVLICGTCAAADGGNAQRTIRVVGEAEITASPDFARIVLGVETTGESAKTAVQENAEITDKVINALKDFGLKENQISTGSFHVYSYQQHVDNSSDKYVTCYRVFNELQIKSDNINDVGKLVDIAINAGANQVQRISFEVENQEELMLTALINATLQARKKGEAIAQGAGITIKGIKSISEENTSYTPYRSAYAEENFSKASLQDTQIIPGDVNVRARVIAEYYF